MSELEAVQVRDALLGEYPPSGHRGSGTFGALCRFACLRGCEAGKLIGGCDGEVQAHHHRHRSDGFGDWLANGEGNVFGLCDWHHRLEHEGGLKARVDGALHPGAWNPEGLARLVGQLYRK